MEEGKLRKFEKRAKDGFACALLFFTMGSALVMMPVFGLLELETPDWRWDPWRHWTALVFFLASAGWSAWGRYFRLQAMHMKASEFLEDRKAG